MLAWSGRPGLYSHSVLVVDDFTETREAMVSMLRTQRFSVVGAASGSIALDLLRGGLRPCVMLLDVRMPEMDGWQLWERMKTIHELEGIPVVILSAERADHARAEAVGIREFLRKPIDGTALVAAVERHCKRHRPPAS